LLPLLLSCDVSSTEHGIPMVSRLSVCLSVCFKCLSVCNVGGLWSNRSEFFEK